MPRTDTPAAAQRLTPYHFPTDRPRYLYFKLNPMGEQPPPAQGHRISTSTVRRSVADSATFVLITWLPPATGIADKAIAVSTRPSVLSFFSHHVHMQASSFPDLQPAPIVDRVRRTCHTDKLLVLGQVVSQPPTADSGAVQHLTVSCAWESSVEDLAREFGRRTGRRASQLHLYVLDDTSAHTVVEDDIEWWEGRRGSGRALSGSVTESLAHDDPQLAEARSASTASDDRSPLVQLWPAGRVADSEVHGRAVGQLLRHGSTVYAYVCQVKSPASPEGRPSEEPTSPDAAVTAAVASPETRSVLRGIAAHRKQLCDKFSTLRQRLAHQALSGVASPTTPRSTLPARERSASFSGPVETVDGPGGTESPLSATASSPVPTSPRDDVAPMPTVTSPAYSSRAYETVSDGAAVVARWKETRRSKEARLAPSEASVAGHITSPSSGQPTPSRTDAVDSPSDAWRDLLGACEIPFHEIQTIDKLGDGKTAKVCRALWTPSSDPHLSPDAHSKLSEVPVARDSPSYEVAVKIFRCVRVPPPEAVLASFRKELLATRDRTHPCLVQVLGGTTYPQLTLVMEYMRLGCLFSVLRSPPPSMQLSHRDRLRIAHDVASGLAALHDRGVLHRDIKSHNILLDVGDDGGVRAKVCVRLRSDQPGDGNPHCNFIHCVMVASMCSSQTLVPYAPWKGMPWRLHRWAPVAGRPLRCSWTTVGAGFTATWHSADPPLQAMIAAPISGASVWYCGSS